MQQVRFDLPQSEMPKYFYNIQADLPSPLPPVIHPGRLDPIGPDDLAPLFPMGLIAQEVSQEREIEIPEPVREAYGMYRQTPFIRAVHLEKHLDTPAKLFSKYEGVSPPGSHKPNTAIAQAFYNKAEGVKRLTTETGAGQWGSALAFATNHFGMECMVYMVRASFDQKPYRKSMIRTWGADIVPSPSDLTEAGKAVLSKDADTPGSLGIAISEAVEDAAKREDTKYSLGSVLNHVMLHQTVIGQELYKQLELAGVSPDIMVGCIGGGSNFAGFTFPFFREKMRGNLDVRIIAVEPEAAPSLTKGSYLYDFGDTACTTPLIKMYTLGHSFIPAPIHSGGLRYHGMAPLVCYLYDLGLMEVVALHQNKIFEAAVTFARTEGIIPAPEPAHVVSVVIDEALKCKAAGEEKVIVFHLCGHGHFDMKAYDDYLSGELVDYELPIAEVEAALADLPNVQ